MFYGIWNDLKKTIPEGDVVDDDNDDDVDDDDDDDDDNDDDYRYGPLVSVDGYIRLDPRKSDMFYRY